MSETSKMTVEKIEIAPRLLTVRQLAKYLSFPESSLYTMVQRREIPFKRFGRKAIRFDLKEIDLWIAQQPSSQYTRG